MAVDEIDRRLIELLGEDGRRTFTEMATIVGVSEGTVRARVQRLAADGTLRIVALCLSGASRAVCGAVAGGSKAALTVHFASAGEKPGDVGDLSAKDGSKETVLALLGMLVRLCPSELPASAGARC